MQWTFCHWVTSRSFSPVPACTRGCVTALFSFHSVHRSLYQRSIFFVCLFIYKMLSIRMYFSFCLIHYSTKWHHRHLIRVHCLNLNTSTWASYSLSLSLLRDNHWPRSVGLCVEGISSMSIRNPLQDRRVLQISTRIETYAFNIKTHIKCV